MIHVIQARRAKHLVAGVTALAAAGILGPAACFFPSDYTFTETDTTGTGGGATTAATTTTGVGGQGGSNTTTTGATTGTGGTGGSATESDCLDGLDNDDNGKIDCEDPACAFGFTCEDPIPVGWGGLGYLALYQNVNNPPPCPHDFPMNAFTGNAALSAEAAICSACGCDDPSGQTCDLVTDLDPNKAGTQPMQISNKSCGVGATALSTLTVPPAWGGACFQNNDASPGGQACAGFDCNTSVQSVLPVASGGSCLPNGGVPTLPDPKWAINAKACRNVTGGGGCPGMKTCRPKPPAPFDAGICIGRPGDMDCPNGFVKNVFYSNYADTRGCTSCACGNASAGSCQITMHLFSTNACDPGTEVASFPAGGCFNLSGNPTIAGRTDEITTPPNGGSCPPLPGGGKPKGTAAPIEPTTICCRP